ncbi:MAG: hypothetical protein HYZ69_01255 [Candidatus Colwellbacteria bacterium]|nr:hypothetical protein [Candidatus Colwellbacteria bacterium]
MSFETISKNITYFFPIMGKTIKKSKMTLEKLARTTANEFAAIRKEMVTKDDLKRFATKDDLKRFATKDDLKRFATKDDIKSIRDDLVHFATKNDLVEFKEEVVREISQKVIASNDKVITKLDNYFKDQAAHNMLHKRIEDKLFNHDQRIEKLEKTVSE